MLDQITWETKAERVASDDQVVLRGLTTFNESAAPLKDVLPLRCFARLPNGPLVGGALAQSWGRCCSLDQIWVDQAYRRKGIGGRLILLVEEEARRRGCTLVYLDTFSFQAPQLYRHLGYEVACEFEGFPAGIVKYIMRKRLQLAT